MKFYTILSMMVIHALSKPSGSPICNIVDTEISKVHSKSELGYSLQVTHSTNVGHFNVQVMNSNRKEMQGLLLYVSSSNSPNHVGKFVSIDTAKYRHVGGLCQKEGVQSAEEGTITHLNSNKVALGKFEWSASTNEFSLPGLAIHGVVVLVDGGVKWQKLTPVVIPQPLKQAATSPSVSLDQKQTTQTTNALPSATIVPVVTIPHNIITSTQSRIPQTELSNPSKTIAYPHKMTEVPDDPKSSGTSKVLYCLKNGLIAVGMILVM